MIYEIWKLFHVLAAIIFLGNITIGIFWKIQADKSMDRQRIADAFKNIILADKIFTMPSVVILFVFGMGAAMQGGYSLIETPWIFGGIIMLAISAFAFMSKLVPIQKQILTLVKDEKKYTQDEYLRLSRRWNTWGTITIIAPYIAVILMVVKP